MDEREQWCRATVTGPDGAVLATLVLEGRGAAHLGVVDAVARLAVLAGRAGAALLLEASSETAELLELAGLPVEVQRQAEGGEQPLLVQQGEEEAHPGDLPG
jgi:hypothetical protein